MKNAKAIDPVCGMEVDESSGLGAEHGGRTYFFCSAHCRRAFQETPEKYLEGGKEGTGNDAAGAGVRASEAADWQNYIPLLVIVALTLLAACAKQVAGWDAGRGWDGMTWMHDFMGFFLVVFSMFKFFDLRGFADGFQMYDLLAKPFRPYAFVYPFTELALGLGYLAQWQPRVIYISTILVMTFGAAGVLRALVKGLDLRCACMGTVLRVPLSTVAVAEDLGMAVMAAAMLALM